MIFSITTINDFFWEYILVPLIVIVSGYFLYKRAKIFCLKYKNRVYINNLDPATSPKNKNQIYLLLKSVFLYLLLFIYSNGILLLILVMNFLFSLFATKLKLNFIFFILYYFFSVIISYFLIRVQYSILKRNIYNLQKCEENKILMRCNNESEILCFIQKTSFFKFSIGLVLGALFIISIATKSFKYVIPTGIMFSLLSLFFLICSYIPWNIIMKISFVGHVIIYVCTFFISKIYIDLLNSTHGIVSFNVVIIIYCFLICFLISVPIVLISQTICVTKKIYLIIESLFLMLKTFLIEFFKESPKNLEESKKKSIPVSWNSIKTILLSLFSAFGMGSILVPISAIMTGGYGAVIWMCIGFIICTQIKYVESFFSVDYYENYGKEHIGGAFLFFNKESLKSKFKKAIYYIFLGSFLLAAADIYQFGEVCSIVKVVTNTYISNSWIIYVSIITLIAFIFVFILSGSLNLLFNIGSIIIPVFLIVYTLMAVKIFQNSSLGLFQIINKILMSFKESISSAINGNPSLLLIQMIKGISATIYATSAGIGGTYLIECEAKPKNKVSHAKLSSLDVIAFAIICFTSCFMFIAQKHAISAGFETISTAKDILIYNITVGQYIFPIMVVICSSMLVISCLTEGLKMFRVLISNKKFNYNIIRCILLLVLVIPQYFNWSQDAKLQLIIFFLGIIVLLNLIFMISKRKDIKY